MNEFFPRLKLGRIILTAIVFPTLAVARIRLRATENQEKTTFSEFYADRSLIHRKRQFRQGGLKKTDLHVHRFKLVYLFPETPGIEFHVLFVKTAQSNKTSTLLVPLRFVGDFYVFKEINYPAVKGLLERVEGFWRISRRS